MNTTIKHQNNMNQYYFLLPAMLMLACTPPSDDGSMGEVNSLFAKNSETAMALIRDFDNEDLDGVRSHFADSARWRQTTFGKIEPTTIEDQMKGWEEAWKIYDFDLATNDFHLLPGVDSDTKKPDGSVRVYFDWDLVRPATDSTERKSVKLSYYESWDFDADGKIWLTQIFGDATAAMNALNDM